MQLIKLIKNISHKKKAMDGLGYIPVLVQPLFSD